MIRLSVNDFERIGMGMMGHDKDISEKRMKCRFNSCFGLEPELCKFIWDELVASKWIRNSSKPKHLFSYLYFLKVYATEENNASYVGSDEKTFRKLVWLDAEGMSKLDVKFVSNLGSNYR